MINLAGVKECDESIRTELATARIYIHDFYQPVDREVPSCINGYLGAWRFQRAWYYWVADAPYDFGVDKDIATEFNKKWFDQVRVEGFAGGKDVTSDQVLSYHIDTQEGLNAFADLIREFDGKAGAELRLRRCVSRMADFQKAMRGAVEDLQFALAASKQIGVK